MSDMPTEDPDYLDGINDPEIVALIEYLGAGHGSLRRNFFGSSVGCAAVYSMEQRGWRRPSDVAILQAENDYLRRVHHDAIDKLTSTVNSLRAVKPEVPDGIRA